MINNGKRQSGLIEAARCRYQEPAWHLFKPASAPRSIAVCLIGNFEERELPAPMLDALVELTQALMREFAIPADQGVSTHRVVDEKMTQCPGKHFPRAAFLARIGAGWRRPPVVALALAQPVRPDHARARRRPLARASLASSPLSRAPH